MPEMCDLFVIDLRQILSQTLFNIRPKTIQMGISSHNIFCLLIPEIFGLRLDHFTARIVSQGAGVHQSQLVDGAKGVAERGKETNTHLFFFRVLLDPPPPAYLLNRVCFFHRYVFRDFFSL